MEQLPSGLSIREITPPKCPHCNQPMQFDRLGSTPYSHHFICGCTGTVFHRNIHTGQDAETV